MLRGSRAGASGERERKVAMYALDKQPWPSLQRVPLNLTLSNRLAFTPNQDDGAMIERPVPEGSNQFVGDFTRMPISAGALTLRAKLATSVPGDFHENEADRIAAEVMSAPESSPQSACRCGAQCPRCKAGPPAPTQSRIQRKTVRPATVSGNVMPAVGNTLRDGGQPLEAEARDFFEARFGYDFSRVRVHTGARAADSAVALGALAYTVGTDIAFGEGRYAPQTAAGRMLLAHELAHVVQQSETPSQTPLLQRKNEETQPKPVKTTFRYGKKEKAIADRFVAKLRAVGIQVEIKEDKDGFEVVLHPMTEAEAQAAAQAKAQADPMRRVTVEHEGTSGAPYIKDVPKCPDTIPIKSPMQRWPECFATAEKADALKAKLEAAHIPAEVVKVSEDQFGLRFNPMTEAEAKTRGAAEIKGRPDIALLSVQTSEKKELHSFTFDIVTDCPNGYSRLGKFLLTAYFLAQEKDFPDKLTDTHASLPGRKFREGFIAKAKLEGSGHTLQDDIINYDTSAKKFSADKCALDAHQKCLKAGESIAVPASIPAGTELLIESVGSRKAVDSGKKIKAGHIDIYFGDAINEAEANKLSKKDMLVCKKDKKD